MQIFTIFCVTDIHSSYGKNEEVQKGYIETLVVRYSFQITTQTTQSRFSRKLTQWPIPHTEGPLNVKKPRPIASCAT